MIAWMIRSVLAAAVLALATWLASLAAGWFGRPRRWVWLAGLGAAALLPFLGLLLPARPTAAPVTGISPAELATLLAAGGGAAGSVRAALPSWLPLAIWALASALLLLEQVYGLRRLARLRRTWAAARLDGADVLIAEQVGPAVVGVLRPAVVVPPWLVAAPESARRMVLAHEWEHVAAGDTRLLALGSLATALLPWSPALWWLQRRLRDAVETDCDARVLAAGCDVGAYGRMLLDAAARPGRRLARAALVERPNLLERRIRAMSAQLPTRPIARAAVLAACAVALVVAACELSSPAAEPTQPRQPATGVTRATTADGNHLTATDTGEIRRIVIDSVPGGQRIRVFHQDGRVETRLTAPPEVLKDSAAAYAAGYAAGQRDHASREARGQSAAVAGTVRVRYGAQIPADTLRVGGDRPIWEARGTASGTAGESPFTSAVIVVDGRPSSMEAMKAIDPARISSINVIKVRVGGAPDTVYVRTKP